MRAERYFPDLLATVRLKAMSAAEAARAQSDDTIAAMYWNSALEYKALLDELEFFDTRHPYYETYLVKFNICNAKDLTKAG
jgi:hypothetical protein